MKKSLVFLLTFLMLTLPFDNPRAISTGNDILTDIDSHWAENDITTLNRMGILNGSSNQALPDDKITRGEFAALTARTLNLKVTAQKQIFSDIPENHIFFDEISATAELGIIKGYANGNFMSENLITREEIMIIISRCIGKESSKSVNFSDITSKYAYMKELKSAVASGIISGYADGSFRPKKSASRAECSAMLIRLLKASESAQNSKTKDFMQSYVVENAKSSLNSVSAAIGSAEKEALYRQNAVELINENNVHVSKNLSNLTLSEFENKGALSYGKYLGKITYVIAYPDGEFAEKNYNYTAQVYAVLRGNSLFVYHFNENIQKDKKINLTWDVSASPPAYAPEGLNVISPSSFQISAETLSAEKNKLFSDVDFYCTLTQPYMNYARQNEFDVWPMYKTDFSLKTSHNFLNNADAQKTSIEYILKYAAKYKFDGINFDFENIYESNRPYLTNHIRKTALALREMGIVISVDVTRKEVTSSTWSMCYDRDAIAETADYVMLMAYDQHYAGSKAPGSVAGITWTEDSVKKTLEEVPSEKLILGIPFYMRLWTLKNGKITSSKAISMQTAYELIEKNLPAYEWSEKDGQYKISWQDGSKTHMFWLENSETVRNRTKIAAKYFLGGVASWRQGLEVSTVWNAIFTEFNKK